MAYLKYTIKELSLWSERQNRLVLPMEKVSHRFIKRNTFQSADNSVI